MTNVTPLEANLFELQGDNAQISYSATSFTGEPQFTFSNQGESRRFSGSEIQVEDTGVGQIVTVKLQNNEGDEGLETLTLLLPVVQLSQLLDVPIQTLAVLSRTLVRVVPGASQLQTYNLLNLSGTAQRVES